MGSKIPKLEKKIVLAALVVSALHLLLIGFAAVKLGITVPTCITDENFTKPGFLKHSDKHYEVHVNAKMWLFQPNYLKLPTHSRLDIFLSSEDVLHGLFIKGTNINLMAVPGSIANASVTFRRPGKYPIICHEFCGSGHQNMQGMIEVVDGLEQAEVAGLPASALASAGESSDSIDSVELSQAAQQGKILYSEKACMGCHSLDGSKVVGPSFKGLYGSTVKLADGTEVEANEDFLKEKIVNPGANTIDGYASGMMPKMPLTDEEVDALIEYIKTIQ